jgi:hypothetical protein
MRILPVLAVLVLVTGCASATPSPSSPSGVDHAEQDSALVAHWVAACGTRKGPEDPACRREHEVMFDTLEMHAKRGGLVGVGFGAWGDQRPAVR